MSKNQTTKKCSKCGIEKPVSGDFNRCAKSPDGRRAYCRDCQAIIRRTYGATTIAKQLSAAWNKRLMGTAGDKARNAVSNAIQKGKMLHATKLLCSLCGSPAREYHHHKGYAKEFRLVVIPVCKPCHLKCHRGNFRS